MFRRTQPFAPAIQFAESSAALGGLPSCRFMPAVKPIGTKRGLIEMGYNDCMHRCWIGRQHRVDAPIASSYRADEAFRHFLAYRSIRRHWTLKKSAFA
jgi:hypothetical protein